MNYKEAREYMNEISIKGSVLGLDSMQKLLERLDHPEEKLRFVHVAGTNGKGSTASFIANILAQAGYRIGRYVSPTILCYEEMIQQVTKDKTEYISKENVARHLTRIRLACEQMVAEGLTQPTPFEVETAMAFLEFVDCSSDVVVLEVGLGGRLDATNVIHNTDCAVITSISMDHMAYLGDTLKEIAIEKAGIIKPRCHVVSYNQREEVKDVLRQEAEEKRVPIDFVKQERIQISEANLRETIFSYDQYKNLKIQLLGEHQIHNACVALEAIKVLQKSGYRISEEAIRDGLILTRWPGRFSIVHQTPEIIVDGAHNEEAAIQLKKCIETYYDPKKLIFIVGIFADKEYEKILKITAGSCHTLYTIESDNPRALSSEQLCKVAKKYHNQVIDAKKIENALDLAIQEASPEETIICFGSLSFLGDVYRYFNLIP